MARSRGKDDLHVDVPPQGLVQGPPIDYSSTCANLNPSIPIQPSPSGLPIKLRLHVITNAIVVGCTKWLAPIDLLFFLPRSALSVGLMQKSQTIVANATEMDGLLLAYDPNSPDAPVKPEAKYA